MTPKELWTEAPRLFVSDVERGGELRDYLATGGMTVSVWIRYAHADTEPVLRFRDERGQIEGEQAIRSLVVLEEVPIAGLPEAGTAIIPEQQAA